MLLDPLDAWVTTNTSLLLTSHRHGNTSTTLLHLLHQHLKHKRTVHLLHHHAANTVQHYNALLAKCSVDAPALVASGTLRYSDVPCSLDSPPDLELLFSTMRSADVVVLTDIHVLLGLGCTLRDVVLLVQRLLREPGVVIATTRVAPETGQLDTLLQCLLGGVTCLDTLESGASLEVDGHITYQGDDHVTSRALYKASEKGVKIFPMGVAPGTV